MNGEEQEPAAGAAARQPESSSFAQYQRAKESAQIIQMRLDTNPLIDRLRFFLSGIREIQIEDPATGKAQVVTQDIGKKRMNQDGCDDIVSWVNSVVNSQTVQGYWPEDSMGNSPKYDTFLARCHSDVLDMLFINRVRWNIDPRELNPIISKIMNLIEMFTSRPIGNRERDSFRDTMVTQEKTIYQPQQKSGIPWPWKRK